MKAILVDDELLALEFLERQINKISDIKIIGKFNKFDLNENYALLEEVDVAFLDIEMPEISGLELAEQLLEIKPTLAIVFVTAFNHYAVQAFEFNAIDYVLKPVHVDRLKQTLERIKKEVKNRPEEFLITQDQLRISVCRELTFELSKDNYDTVKWRTAKAQEVFLYLLQNRGESIRKSKLIEILWPDFHEKNAYSQLYTAIYHLRKTISRFNDYLSIKNMHDSYVLYTNYVLIDIVDWENKITLAPPITLDLIGHYETIMNLYTGPYLQAYDYVWAEPERFRYEQLWIKTAYKIADCYYRNDSLEEAEAWYIEICTLRQVEEKAHFSLMKLYDKLGYGLLVKHQYGQLEKALNKLDIQVNPRIKEWFDESKQGV